MAFKTKILFVSFTFFLSHHLFFAQVDDAKEKQISEKQESWSMKEDIYEFRGKDLPAFELNLLNREKLNSELLRGKPTLINFWFTNCAPCIDEMPVLNEIQEQFDGKVNFIAITFQSREEVNPFLQKVDFNFQHVVDARDYIKSFGFFGYPKTLLLDRDLRILEIEKRMPKSVGAEKKENQEEFRTRLENELSALLNKD